MQEVAEYLVAIGQPTPNPLLSVAWLARDEAGRIVGMSLLQSIPVVEPFQGEDVEIIKELFRRTEEFIHQSGAPRVFMHTSNRGMQAMLLRKGAQKLDDPLFDWQR
jgi:hypothetical protein